MFLHPVWYVSSDDESPVSLHGEFCTSFSKTLACGCSITAAAYSDNHLLGEETA